MKVVTIEQSRKMQERLARLRVKDVAHLEMTNRRRDAENKARAKAIKAYRAAQRRAEKTKKDD